MTIFFKLHETQGKKILACCDEELLGKTISTPEIDFNVRESFYKEKKTNREELKQLLEEADSINLVGEECVSVALENEWIKKEDIITIDTVPHVQIFKV